jgi:hypothetical protein
MADQGPVDPNSVKKAIDVQAAQETPGEFLPKRWEHGGHWRTTKSESLTPLML